MSVLRSAFIGIVLFLPFASVSQQIETPVPNAWNQYLSRILLDPRVSMDERIQEITSTVERGAGGHLNGVFSPAPTYDPQWTVPFLHQAVRLTLDTVTPEGNVDTRLLRAFLDNGVDVQAKDGFFNEDALGFLVSQSQRPIYQTEGAQAGVMKISTLLTDYGAMARPPAEVKDPATLVSESGAALQRRLDRLTAVRQETSSEPQKRNLDAALEKTQQQLLENNGTQSIGALGEVKPESPKIDPPFNLLTIGALREDVMSYLDGLVNGNERLKDIRKLDIDLASGKVSGVVALRSYHVVHPLGRRMVMYGSDKENLVSFEFNARLPTQEKREVAVDNYPNIVFDVGSIQKIVEKHKDTIKY